jgi:hypothetical protein
VGDLVSVNAVIVLILAEVFIEQMKMLAERSSKDERPDRIYRTDLGGLRGVAWRQGRVRNARRIFCRAG